MQENKNQKDEAITRRQMMDAVVRSGYLMEQRIFPIIESFGYYVKTNPVYPDSTTGKSREYDFSALSALKVYRGEMDYLWLHVVGECLNNSQPVVFFSSKQALDFMFHEDIRCAGIPLKFPSRDSPGTTTLTDFFHMDKFHHYCRGVFSTQYCSFQWKKDKREWLAWHDDEHHGIFNALVEATRHECDDFFASWTPPKGTEVEPVNINLFYPLLILHDDLYECRQSRNGPRLIARKHIQFRKSVITGRKPEVFHIDVIVESYLDEYLKMLDKEHDELKKRFQRNKGHVRKAVDLIVREAKKYKATRRKPDFRAILAD